MNRVTILLLYYYYYYVYSYYCYTDYYHSIILDINIIQSKNIISVIIFSYDIDYCQYYYYYYYIIIIIIVNNTIIIIIIYIIIIIITHIIASMIRIINICYYDED